MVIQIKTCELLRMNILLLLSINNTRIIFNRFSTKSAIIGTVYYTS
jgi:hypothetical protein